jgi:hypothetical protein
MTLEATWIYGTELTTVISMTCLARRFQELLLLVEGVTFSGAVRMRILDAAGHLLHPKTLAL